MTIGLVIALIKALAQVDPTAITTAVDAWLEAHPEATTTVEDGSITYAKLASALAALIDGKQESVPATSRDIGKYLKAKTVVDGVVTEYEFGSPGGGGGGGAVDDVQVNGVSVVNSSGVANVPLASSDAFGVLKISGSAGIKMDSNGAGYIGKANDTQIKDGANNYCPIVPDNQHKAIFYGLSKLAGENLSSDTVTVGTYPEKSLSAIGQMLNAPVSVSGTTPTITAKAGVRYICGECSTLSITAPESGCIDVVFESGSTPTVLTVSSAKSGVSAIRWANGFDPTSLDANTTYEVNILDGEFGVVGSWT